MFTCEICSAAATLGFTTSQVAITKVLGTLPSVCIVQIQRNSKYHYKEHECMLHEDIKGFVNNFTVKAFIHNVLKYETITHHTS